MIILFVCTGNTCRSVMAEIIAKDFFKKKIIQNKVFSAGIFCREGEDMTFNAKKVLIELGIKLKKHKSKSINKQILKNIDVIITMTKKHKEIILKYYKNYIDNINIKINTLSFFVLGKDKDIEDPFMKDISTYRSCRNIILNYIEKIKWKEL